MRDGRASKGGRVPRVAVGVEPDHRELLDFFHLLKKCFGTPLYKCSTDQAPAGRTRANRQFRGEVPLRWEDAERYLLLQPEPVREKALWIARVEYVHWSVGSRARRRWPLRPDEEKLVEEVLAAGGFARQLAAVRRAVDQLRQGHYDLAGTWDAGSTEADLRPDPARRRPGAVSGLLPAPRADAPTRSPEDAAGTPAQALEAAAEAIADGLRHRVIELEAVVERQRGEIVTALTRQVEATRRAETAESRAREAYGQKEVLRHQVEMLTRELARRTAAANVVSAAQQSSAPPPTDRGAMQTSTAVPGPGPASPLRLGWRARAGLRAAVLIIAMARMIAFETVGPRTPQEHLQAMARTGDRVDRLRASAAVGLFEGVSYDLAYDLTPGRIRADTIFTVSGGAVAHAFSALPELTGDQGRCGGLQVHYAVFAGAAGLVTEGDLDLGAARSRDLIKWKSFVPSRTIELIVDTPAVPAGCGATVDFNEAVARIAPFQPAGDVGAVSGLR